MNQELFEEDYFSSIYHNQYLQRNPAYKWASFLRQVLAYRSQGKLLDIGCGWGLFLEKAQANFVCSGCDISTYALQQARQRLSSRINLFQGSLGSIPTENSYDIVTCFDVIEHVPDLNAAWENLSNLLAPKGLLVIAVPVYDGPFGNLTNHLDKDFTHVHRKARTFWVNQVKKNFNLLDFTGIWRYFLFNRFYINLLSSRSRQITTAILLIAEKP